MTSVPDQTDKNGVQQDAKSAAEPSAPLVGQDPSPAPSDTDLETELPPWLRDFGPVDDLVTFGFGSRIDSLRQMPDTFRRLQLSFKRTDFPSREARNAYVFSEEGVGHDADPVFVYAVAVQGSIPQEASRWKERALRKYRQDPAEYDQILRNLIPADFRNEARSHGTNGATAAAIEPRVQPVGQDPSPAQRRRSRGAAA
jgi:hypothetical protein